MNKVSYMANQTEDSNIYYKKFDIKCPLVEGISQQSAQLAAYNLAFSDDSRFILMYFRPRVQDRDRQKDLRDGIYLLWDIQTNSSVHTKLWGSPEHRLDHINFPHHISGHYQFMQDFSNGSVKQQSKTMADIPVLIER